MPAAVVTAIDPEQDDEDALLVRPDGHLLWRGTDPSLLARRLDAAGIGGAPGLVTTGAPDVTDRCEE